MGCGSFSGAGVNSPCCRDNCSPKGSWKVSDGWPVAKAREVHLSEGGLWPLCTAVQPGPAATLLSSVAGVGWGGTPPTPINLDNKKREEKISRLINVAIELLRVYMMMHSDIHFNYKCTPVVGSFVVNRNPMYFTIIPFS